MLNKLSEFGQIPESVNITRIEEFKHLNCVRTFPENMILGIWFFRH